MTRDRDPLEFLRDRNLHRLRRALEAYADRRRAAAWTKLTDAGQFAPWQAAILAGAEAAMQAQPTSPVHDHSLSRHALNQAVELGAIGVLQHDAVTSVWVKGVIVRFPCGGHLFFS
jgi:hypothetical protein